MIQLEVKYYNSFLQVLYHIPRFVELIMNVREMATCDPLFQRQQSSINILIETQRVFSLLLLSKRRDVNPGEVLKHLLDDGGKRVIINCELGVEECLMYLIGRLQEGVMLCNAITTDMGSS